MKKISCLGILLSVSFSSLLTQPPSKPKLVILIAVDQMRADYLDRFTSQFTGGFKRLLTEGVVYTNADLGYARSETGPGHTTLATGAFPRTHGITENDWIDPLTKDWVYCVGDSTALPVEGEGGGYSPRNIAATTFADWLKKASPTSKVVAVSLKDRAAIPFGGRRPDIAYWYNDKIGRMVTSDYYTKELPGWVKEFNASGWIEKNVPAAWSKSLPADAFTDDTPDDNDAETPWDSSTAFPHLFDPKEVNDQIKTSPYGDRLVLDFALAALHAEQLGKHDATDYLAIGFCSTDYIGHDFGPNSHEIREQFAQLDRTLNDLFIALEQQVGKENFVVALSADHGVLPLPEYLTTVNKISGRRIIAKDAIIPRVKELERSLQEELGITEDLFEQNAFLNYRAAAAKGIDSLWFERRIRDGLLKIDGVVDVYFRRDMMSTTASRWPYLGKYQRGFYPLRDADFLVRFCENCLVGSRTHGTTHGTVYRYDTHVPVIFWGMKLKPQRINRAVYTVDVAPTLAAILGIRYPKSVEGNVLREIVDSKPARK